MTEASSRRLYTDGCAGSHALNLVGDRWALPVVRELMLGPKRFTKLRRDLPGLSANMLTQRLADMTSAGIVERRHLPAPADVQVYGLTRWGSDLWPVIAELVRWGIRSPDFPGYALMSPTSFLLSLRAFFDPSRFDPSRFDPSREQRLAGTIRLDIEGDMFTVEIKEGTISVSAGPPPRPDVTVTAGTGLLKRLFYMKEAIPSLRDSGLSLSGNGALIEDIVRAFPVAELRNS